MLIFWRKNSNFGHFSNAEASVTFVIKLDAKRCNSILQELIDTNQGLLSSLGVSHPSLEKIISITAKQQIHAKLTGAGGGGFAFALLTPWHSQKQIDAVKEDLENEGFVCWETKLAVDGVQFSLE